MSKIINKSTEGRRKLANGVNKVADAVKVTLGAKGRNVIIDQPSKPHITKDGVTVARNISLEDRTENMGASLIQEVAMKTVELSGDGTTTSVVLAQAMINSGLKAIEAGASPIDLKKGMEDSVTRAVHILRSLSKPIDNDETIKQIATISANNDSEIGQLIADGIAKVGKDGLISVEESQTHDTTITTVEGMKIDRGYLSPHFVLNRNKMTVELTDAFILMYDKKLSSIHELVPMLEKLTALKKSLLIIADDVDGEALSTFVVNNAKGILKVCAIRKPDFGENSRMIMDDIAVLTGGKFISEDLGMSLKSLSIDHLGKAGKITITKDSTIIVDGKGEKSKIQIKLVELEERIKNAEEPELSKVKIRLAKINNGIAVLKVGGVTDTEMKEKRDRIDDALCATKSAIDEGYVAGGGVTLLSIGKRLDVYGNADYRAGINVIKESLEAPFRQILANAGVNPNKYIKEILGHKSLFSSSEALSYGNGYNVKTDVVEDLFLAGVIDPTKVVRVALENAASIAGIFLTTECVLTEKFDK